MLLGFRFWLAHSLAFWFTRYRVWPFGKLQVTISHLLLPKPTGAIIISTNYNFRISINPSEDLELEDSLYYYGNYEAGTVHLMKQCLKKGDTFIDVGSNIGFISLCAAQLVESSGHVHAIEPDPEIYNILQKNISLNGFSQIQPHNIAFGQDKTVATLYAGIKQQNRGASSMIPQRNKEGVAVQVMTMDQHVNEYVGQVDMVKIDVEGWEMEVLKGASRVLSKYQPILCVEYDQQYRPDPQAGLMMLEFIQESGYRIFKLSKTKAFPSSLIEIAKPEDLPIQDNLFCFTAKHLSQLDLSIKY